MSALENPELTLSPLEVDQKTAQFDLNLNIWETKKGLSGFFEYNTDLFDADTIRRMEQHFQILLAAIVEQPTQQISNLSLLTPAEEHQLLVWGKAESETSKYQVNCCLHQLFESQVERSPGAIAVTFEDQQLTYQELNQKANKVAHHLQKLGVKPEVSVGICMERSLEMVIGILGILKAGGAYVPLDPTYPKERLFFTLQDASVPVLLTQQGLLKQGLLELPENVIQVCIDTDISENTDTNPSSLVNPDNRAYIIYTSGSTGKPKGVEISHRNVVRLFQATQDWYNFNQQDVWTLFHSYAFDFSVWELWGALVYGGRLVVVPYWVSRSPEEFYQLLCKEKVTVLNQTPSAFRQLIRIEETGISKKTELRLVIFGGEALDLQSLKPWFERHGDRRPQLINMYGITETTVHVTYRPVTDDLIKTSNSVIGRQIPDLQLYILDKHRQPVPIGVKGEIYVGGAGVARGYLNRPDLNKEKFIPNPFSNQPNARLYKSGDLGRYLPNGDIEYLGRIDHQVKIRGFRIELGEIETALHQHPAVRETTVIVREDTPGEKQLVAYVVPELEQVLDSSELRSFLVQQLPNYLAPQFFVILDAIPLTPNGKVDRRALPIPDGLRPELQVVYIPPTTDLQKTIAIIWQQALQVEKVGIEDNFFDLGGHSLLMVQVHNQLQTHLKQELSIIDLFQYPTISSLNQYLSATNISATNISATNKVQDDSEARLEKRSEGKNRLKERLKNR
jgi:amino acid adenylation domain-containing protein